MPHRTKYDLPSRVEVGPGTVGKGVFAKRQFRKGQVIGHVRGKIIPAEGYESRYCMDLGNDLVLEPDEPFRYMNHCCEPNAQLFYWYDPEGESEPPEQLWVHALKTIRPGEELFIDYAWPADSAIPCACLSEQCRGWIVDPAERDQLPESPLAKKKAKAKAARNAETSVNVASSAGNRNRRSKDSAAKSDPDRKSNGSASSGNGSASGKKKKSSASESQRPSSRRGGQKKRSS